MVFTVKDLHNVHKKTKKKKQKKTYAIHSKQKLHSENNGIRGKL